MIQESILIRARIMACEVSFVGRREDMESLDEPVVTREKKHGLDGATRIGLKREKNGSNGHY